ncbi:MAG TPA: hypothetical protein VGC18_11555 [Lacisediminihabitans sp.]|uniref:hypothetical protein n=1 Tax=Lacisediminihabitans sp. TaxID=2787631 RepID=UPI002EDB230E
MATWAPQKNDTLDALAAEILSFYGVGRSVIAVDGTSNAGTAAFADGLAEAIVRAGHTVFRASESDFRSPEAHPSSAIAYYEGAFDRTGLVAGLVEPFRAGTPFALAAGAEPTTDAQADAVLVVDGVFLNRQELSGLWNYSIFVEKPLAPSSGSEDGAIEVGADEVYLDRVRPRAAAVAIIDNRDPEHPRRVFADAC